MYSVKAGIPTFMGLVYRSGKNREFGFCGICFIPISYITVLESTFMERIVF
jgi:hypothetical protein